MRTIQPLQGLTEDMSLRVPELYVQGFIADAIKLFQKWHQAGRFNDYPPRESWYNSQILIFKKNFD